MQDASSVSSSGKCCSSGGLSWGTVSSFVNPLEGISPIGGSSEGIITNFQNLKKKKRVSWNDCLGRLKEDEMSLHVHQKKGNRTFFISWGLDNKKWI